ncbi:TIM-barrel domain-containing protein [Rhodanobacter sp. FW102-FHT14D06]|uniref:TIM-barrel domain-containing protein n=2 Tax=unclassified Rhodanobacter TaxID=2621553 RepID=A0AB74UQY0_9GAMM
MIRSSALLAGIFATMLALAPAVPAMAKAPTTSSTTSERIDIPTDTGSVRITLPAANVVHLSALVDGKSPARSMVIDPALASAPTGAGEATTALTLDSPQVHVRYDRAAHSLSIADAQDHVLLHIADVSALAHGKLSLGHAAGDPMYGVSGYDAFTSDVGAGMLRQGKLEAKAGEQGWAGAPLAWSTAGYAVLADIDGGHFTLAPASIDIAAPEATPLDVYVIVGAPKAIFAAVADLSGHTPLFPKWAMGFTNSQWGIDQKELLQIVDTYRARHIPIDNFTLDFDWKAWGEDNYGEFRWNPAKFPDGPGGALAKQLHARGIQLTGIMKPRLHVDTVEGRYATEHDFWVPGEKVSDDYFSHKPVKNIDFDIPAARTWFAELAMKYGFDQGIVGWWNDEADTTGSDTEFMNMQRALYVAQRAQSKLRVWSVNRNFWLGSQRYAYGLWSGDIDTGFASMAGQRARMLSAINVGAMQWGMDGGGFKGHPSNENYARWIQFGAFTPIFRVHGAFDEKRQPWVYGPVAEKAATAAIRLRYALIPYIYSYEYARHVDGVGLVRPLPFDWPHDPKVANDVDSWLFGDYLLVSPVVQQGQTEKHIYLPAGTWLDWFTGKSYAGGQTITLAVDATHWSDIPLFVREGAIVPTQAVQDYVGQKPVTEISLDAFPGDQRTSFDYYDDDGSTYAYEHGAYFRQSLSLQQHGDTVTFRTGKPEGSFHPALRTWLLKIHGHTAQAVQVDGKPLAAEADAATLHRTDTAGWATGKDRYGPVTWVRLPAGKTTTVTLHDRR